MAIANYPVRYRFLVALMAVLALGLRVDAQIYERDLAFAPELVDETLIPRFSERTDGELWVSGMTFLDGERVDGIARYRADGTLRDVLSLEDPLTAAPLVVATMVQSGDATIIYTGDRLVRITSGDTLDPLFAVPDLSAGSFVRLYAQPDGGILIASLGQLGEHPPFEATWQHAARFRPDGTFDASFSDPAGPVLAVDAVGRIYIEVGPQVQRLLASGLPDPAWIGATLSSWVTAAAVDSNGGLMVLLGSGANSVVRLDATGAIDGTFQLAGPETHFLYLSGGGLRVLSDGRVLILIGHAPFSSGGVMRLLATGQRDESYVLPDGVGAGVAFWGGQPLVVRSDHARPFLAGRLREDATLDPAWTPRFGRNGIVNAVRRDLAGRVLVAGFFNYVDDAPRTGVARFLADGSLDPDFVPPPGLLPSTGTYPGFNQINLGRDGSVFLQELLRPPGPGIGVVRWTRLTETGALHPDPVPTVSGPYGATAAADGTLFFSRGRVRNDSVPPGFSVYFGSELVRRNAGSSIDAVLPVDFSEHHFTTPSAYLPATLSAPPIEMMEDGRILVPSRLAAAGGRGGLVSPADGATVSLPFDAIYFNPAAPIYGGTGIVVAGEVLHTLQRADANGVIDPGFAPSTALGDVFYLADDGRDGAIVVRPPPGAYGSLYSLIPPPGDVLRLTATGAVDPGFARAGDPVVAAAAAADASLFFATQDGLERYRAVDQDIAIANASSNSVVAGRGLVLSATVGVLGNVTWRWQRNGVDVPGATGSTFELPHVGSLDAGTYRAIVTAPGREIVSNAMLITVVPSTGRLINLSGRSLVSSNDAQQIAGFYLAEEADVIVRAVGPTLGSFDVDVPLLDPAIELRRDQTPVAGNTGWGGTTALTEAFLRVGAFPLPPASADSAFRLTLPAGGYTARISGTADGIGLAEIYLDDDDAQTPFSNLSLRSFTGHGEDSVIAGFHVAGEGPQRLLIRAVGPGLSDHGVAGVAPDPRLTVYRGQVVVAENDDATPEALGAEAESGAFALSPGAGDAALVVYLEAGGYTAVVTGDPGIVLLEVFTLPTP